MIQEFISTYPYLFYVIRWQLSTPLLVIVLLIVSKYTRNRVIGSVIANLIGGLIFYWVDLFIIFR